MYYFNNIKKLIGGNYYGNGKCSVRIKYTPGYTIYIKSKYCWINTGNKKIFAIELFKTAKLSLGQSAKLANLCKVDFINDYLDRGEASVITLAKELKINCVIID